MNSPRPRPLPRLLFVLAAVAVTVLGLVGPATAAAPYCGITWGSQPKEAGGGAGPSYGWVTDVRSGQHPCFDRLVVDLVGSSGTGYDVRYVRTVLSDPKGDVVPLRGGAFLRVVVRMPAYDLQGNSTYDPTDPRELVPTSGYATFRQVALTGSFEGVTSIGLGVRARLPFRVFTLSGPGASVPGGRLVIDVANHW
jgi:hypothetical protein